MFKYLALLLISLPLSTLANDTSFGGAGVLPVPITDGNIAMLNEHIDIRGFDIDRENMQGSWQYLCDYTFKNLSDKNLTLRMGFPFPVYGHEEENISLPAGIKIQKGGALVYRFSTTVDGKNVSVTRSKIQPLPDNDLAYTDAFLWQMTFAPSQIVRIHHDYTTGITLNSMGQITVMYVLKTGRLWKGGSIGRAIFEVYPNTPTMLCSEISKENAAYLQPTPPGMTVSRLGKIRSYHWEIPNFSPTQDLSLCLMTGKNYVRYTKIFPVLNMGTGEGVDLNKMNASQRRILLNSIYAIHGRRFVDPNLQTYFDKQWWYQPNDNYNDSLLSSEDKQAIDILAKQR